MSFRLRLTLLYSGLIATALILFSVAMWGIFRWTFFQSTDQILTKVAADVSFFYREMGRLPAPNSMADRSTFVLLRTEDRILRQSDNFTGVFPLPSAARYGQPVWTFETDRNGERYRLYTLPIVDAGQVLFYVQVAHSLELLEMAGDRIALPVVGGAILFMGLGALGAWAIARRAVAPMVRVAEAARAIGASTDLSLRVPHPGTDDEVNTLVSTFNDMLDQLEGLYGRLAASVDAQRRFAADASHELRTPLTIIRGNIEYLQKAGELDPEALADMATEAERMSRLVEELLTLARSDSAQPPELKPVPLGPLVAEACRKAQALPHEVEFKVEIPEALNRVVVMGHGEWLVRAMLILIDNAFKYTPAGSVTVRSGRQGDGVVIQVADTGIGIGKEDLPHIFDRFYRADRARVRGGTGLGLAIARWVAGLHGGTVTATSEAGKGSTFSIWLPVHRGTPPAGASASNS